MAALQRLAAAIMALFAMAGPAAAQETVKVGIVTSFSGFAGAQGRQVQQAIELYLEEHNGRVGDTRVEVIYRDDGGVNPERAKQLAQELILRDRVAFLGGFLFSPNALAIAPLVTESKTPTIVFMAAAADLTRRSPYITRTSFTMWQVTGPVARWAARNGLDDAMIVVADYAAGHDARDAFRKAYTEAGGQIAGEILMPLRITDFTPFVQRIKDRKPKAVYLFVVGGAYLTGFMKTFADLGLREDGIAVLGTGETDELELPATGDSLLGAVTALQYSPHLDTPRNRAFVAAYRRKFGADAVPNYTSVHAYDGMHIVFETIRRLGPKFDGDKAMAVIKGMTIDSPRGPVLIDPVERDIVQNVYLRRVERIGGGLGNVVFDVAPMQKDPWKELNR